MISAITSYTMNNTVANAVNGFRLNISRMTQKISSLAIPIIGIVALSNLPQAYAGPCEETESICVRACLGGGDGREAGACLIGCKLAYWFCKWFTGK